MHIVIFGPQGSGKGTQAELIARRHGLAYISTGDIFRYHLKNQTKFGQRINQYVTAGKLVPDDLTNEVVEDRIQQPDCTAGFVLDGYPRNQQQLDFLNQITTIDYAMVIELNDAAAIERLTNRLACVCGLSYHNEHNPPQRPGICDRCGSQLFKRQDDTPQAIAQRLKIYHQETEPLLTVYQHQGILHRIDGSLSIDRVYQQVEDILSHQG
jgi:adenylate kinase